MAKRKVKKIPREVEWERTSFGSLTEAEITLFNAARQLGLTIRREVENEPPNDSAFKCPICQQWYDWYGNCSGLFLMDIDVPTLVCKKCEQEGERRNRQFMEEYEARQKRKAPSL